MKVLTRFQRIAVMVMLISTSGCGEWPPHRDTLSEHVTANRTQIEQLVSAVTGSEFGRIQCINCWDDDVPPNEAIQSLRFIDGKWHYSDNPDAPRFLELLKTAGVSGVHLRSGGEVYLEIPVSPPPGSRSYIAQVFYDIANRQDSTKECESHFKAVNCGVCKVTVDEEIWVRYTWHPTKASPQTRKLLELEKYEEYSDQYGEEMDKCREDGLLALGYEHAAN